MSERAFVEWQSKSEEVRERNCTPGFSSQLLLHAKGKESVLSTLPVLADVLMQDASFEAFPLLRKRS